MRQQILEVQYTVDPGGRSYMLPGSVRLYSTQVASRSHAKFPGGNSVAYRDKYSPEHEVPVFALGTWSTPVRITRSEVHSHRGDPCPDTGSSSILLLLRLE